MVSLHISASCFADLDDWDAFFLISLFQETGHNLDMS
jgi:hypothetical protein